MPDVIANKLDHLLILTSGTEQYLLTCTNKKYKFLLTTTLTISAKNMGSIAVRFLFLVLPSLIVAFFLFSLKLPDLSALFGFLCSLVFSIIVSFFLNFILGLLSMITMNIRNINWGYNALLRFFSGQMVPLWIFPSALGVISDFLPFR